MLPQGAELLDGLEDVNQLLDPLAEQLELAEDLILAEIELLALRRFLERGFGLCAGVACKL